MRVCRKVMAIAIFAATVTVTASAEQTTQWIWNRHADFSVRPTADNGTTNGNPSADQYGTPVWGYEVTTGGGPLGSPSPWYAQPTNKMVWNASWFGGGPTWATGLNWVPLIDNTSLLDHDNNDSQAPLVRWTNPLLVPASLTIEGNLLLKWADYSDTNRVSYPVDMVVAHVSHQTGITTALFTATQTASFGYVTGTVSASPLPVNLSLDILPGDQVLISVQTRWDVSMYQHHYNMYDWVNDGITLTATPEPATLSLLAIAGLLVLKRHRKGT